MRVCQNVFVKIGRIFTTQSQKLKKLINTYFRVPGKASFQRNLLDITKSVYRLEKWNAVPCWDNQRHFDVQFRILWHLGPIENVNESEKTWPGLNVVNVSGQVGAGRTEADAIEWRHSDVQSNSNFFVCTCENEDSQKESGSCSRSSKYYRSC